MESSTAVSPPPVELQEGTAGNSTIYTNGTSALVSVEPSGIGIDVEDYVDNNSWDEDGSADKGTHGNFTAQKYGPDSINDTLTETSTSSEWLNVNANDTTYTDWTTNGSSPYLDAQDQPTNYVYVVGTGGEDIGWFDFPNTTLSGSLNVNISIYCNNDDDTGNDYANVYVDYTGSGAGTDVGDVAQHTGWQYDTIDLGAHTVSEVNNFRVYFDYQKVGGGDDVRIDHVRIGVSVNCELDLEVQWTNVDYDEENELLCIYGGTMSAENLTVDVWYNSAWQNVFTNLSSGWNNVSVSSYLDSSNFTIRFKGGNETGDTTQNTWNIDATLLHVWTEPREDYVDNNTSDEDGSADKGTHSNFTAQQYGPDSINDTLTEENTNDKEDYVDNNTSDVDNSTDKGTHSSFTAQQSGPDSVNDALTEGNTGSTDTLLLYVNADDGTRTDWTRVGTSPYLDAIDYNVNYTHALGMNLEVGDFGFADSGKSTEQISTVEVQLYVRHSSAKQLYVFVWDGSSWTSLNKIAISASWGWVNWTAITVLDTWTKIDAAKIYLRTDFSSGTYEADCARLKVEYFVTNNYELDLEVQWTTVDYDKSNEELCIYGGSMGAENITVDAWNGTGWENLFTDLNSGWNNVSVTSYLNSSTFTIRFKGGNETGDTTQNTWNIDATLIHVWGGGTNYELDLEVQWTSATYTFTAEELCIYTGTTDAEDVKVDVWNGSVWINVFADLTADSWNNISVTSYLNSSTFTIRFKGGNETSDTTQNTWNIDTVLLHVWPEGGGEADFNYVLKFLEKDNSNWTVRLKAYDQSSLSRIDNCSIYIYDGSNSTQIIILNGAYNQQTGSWYDLNASDTEYIWMHVETSSAGTSYIYAYLEIRVPNSTVYARYIITFKIT